MKKLLINRTLLKTFGPLYGIAFFFSMFINLLSLAVPLHMLLVFDRVFTGRSPATLVIVTVIALGSLLIMGLLETLRSRLLTRLSLRLDAALTEPTLRAMFSPHPTPAGIASYASGAADVNAVKNFLGGTGIFAFFDIPWLPLYLAVSFMLHPVIGWVSLAGAVILLGLLLVTAFMTNRAGRERSASSQDAESLLRATRRNVHTVYAMGMLPALVKRWQDLHRQDMGLESRNHHRTGAGDALNRSVRMALQAVILSVGAALVIANEITTGGMIVGSIMMGKALQPLDLIMAGWKQFQQARQAASRLSSALAAGSEAGDIRPVPLTMGQRDEAGLLVRDLELRIGPTPILNNINLRLEPGRVMGVVGPSGSGKSSLAKTIIGLYPPSGGQVLLDGKMLPAMPDDEKGKLLGYLPQDVELFPVTVGENIGRLDNSDSEAIIAAAKIAGVHDMILRLPQGYDTLIMPRAANLSAGQRQRIALARALYGNPRLLILDEPDANLDDEGSQAMIRAIKEVSARSAMVLVISHRDWISGLADTIYEMEEGGGRPR